MPAVLYLPEDQPTMQLALYTWIFGQIGTGGLLIGRFATAPYTVIWGDQDGPYPGHPYAVLRLVSPPDTIGGLPARGLVDQGATADERIEFDSEFTFRCELLARTPLDPASGMDEVTRLAHALRVSLHSSQVLEALNVAGLAVVNVQKALNVPVVAGFGFERRVRFDAIFRARTRLDVIDVPFLDENSLKVRGQVSADHVSVEGTAGTPD